MLTDLYWVNGPWLGKLAMAAHPRGGDWLQDEMAVWRRAGIDVVLSLLTSEEEQDLDLQDEPGRAKDQEMNFISLPIPDRQAPESQAEVAEVLEDVDAMLSDGKNVVIHCRQGVGRTGMIAACLLVGKGVEPDAAVARLSAARGFAVPETAAQRRWIDRHAAILAEAK